MRVTIATAALLSAARAAARLVPNSTYKQNAAYQNLRIVTRGDRLVVIGHQRDLAIEAQRSATIEAPGAATIAARTLIAMLVATDHAEVTIEAGALDGDATIEAGAMRLTLNAPTAAVDFLEPGAMPEGSGRFSMPSAGFLALLDATSWAMADAGKAVIAGVNLVASGRQLRAVATDGYTLASAVEPLAYSMSKTVEGTIPAGAVREILRAIQPGGVSVAMGPDRFAVSSGDWTISGLLAGGKYPAWQGIIPKPGELAPFTLRLADLAGVVRRAEALGASSYVGFTPEPGGLATNAEGSRGRIGERIAREGDDHGPQVDFNAGVLAPALRAIKSPRVRMQFAGPLKPAMLYDTDHAERFALVMPINRL